ncbi:NADH-quinone oxidoreductase subunit N [Actinomadura sp. WAC 06369]|uniref:NADH-quinone oxidoreductase subunit N n=1 Tax=Actinomadura sp. WAC 06369 TaxID=2203193 RepID=UPI000F7688E9|nr:NADH-quinone oxidoreductase subunit N [Actinomadura sp. WAC 06369]RSN71105.1 NADH-quinone oxidoreductase subunit N [Actinomadura sp. WAC 06369]
MIQSIDYAAVAPPLIVAVAAVGLLLGDAFGLPRRALGALSGGALAAAFAAVLALGPGDCRATFCLPDGLRGDGPASCSYVADDFTLAFQGIVLLGALVVVLLSVQQIADAKVPAGEYHFLLLAAVVGALALVAARDLILLVVALETLSLPVFALVGLRRYDGTASEAALKLFLVSVVSAAIMLFGVSLLYGATGAMHLDRIAPALAGLPAELDAVAAAGIVLLLAGFGFKVAAVPFHFWAPDVYQGAPLPVAAFLSVVSKAAGFAGLAIVLSLGLPAYAHVWGPLVAVLAAATMTLGNLVALRQRTAVRLLAWSSVAQSGYMLAPLAVGTDHLPEAVAATTAYVAFYAVMNLGAFAVVTGFRRRTDERAQPIDTLDDFRGLARRAPATAAALAFFLICLAGLPPGVMGLFAKVVVFRGVVAGDVVWLAVVMAVNTVVGLYYYLLWAARLFAAPTGPAAETAPGLPVRFAVAATAAGAIVLSVAPQVILQTVAAAS